MKIYELCLEQAVLEFDDRWNVTSIKTTDFSDNDLQTVKKKLNNGIKWIWFKKAKDEYDKSESSREPKFSKRLIEQAETDTHNEIKEMTDIIINTLDDVDRAEKRKEPKFIADEKQKKEWKITWKFSSRWYKEDITINMDSSKKIKSITIEWINTTIDDRDEWFRTVNLINWIHNNAEENPRWWKYWLYHRSTGWDLERDVRNNMFDVDILENDYLEEYFPTIHEDDDFLDYINDFL